MWPTFYIPSNAISEFVSAGTDHLCDLFSVGASSSGTIPTPGTVEAGDVQVVMISYRGTSPENALPAAAGSPWYLWSDSSLIVGPAFDSTTYGTGTTRIYWRIYDSADGDFSMTTGAGEAIYGAYVSVILNNQNTADPLYSQCVFDSENSGTDTGYGWATPLTDFDIAASGDLVLFASTPRSGFSSSSETPAATFSCTDDTGAGSPVGHTMAGLEAYRNRQNNLLTHTPSMDASGWSNTGITKTAGSTSTFEPGCKLEATSSATQHYLEQTVTLTAGKSYMYSVSWTGQNASYPFGTMFMTYVKADSSEHGIGVKRSGTVVEVTGSTEVVWASNTGVPTSFLQEQEGTSLYHFVTSFMITPSSTEDYDIRLYVTTEDTVVRQPSDSYAGGSTVYIYVNGVTLTECPAFMTHPIFLPESSSQRLPGDYRGVLMAQPRRIVTGTSDAGYIMLALRRDGGARPACRLAHYNGRNHRLKFDDLALTTTKTAGVQTFVGYEALVSTHLVYSYLAGKKYYFEMTATDFGSGAADDSYSIGVCVGSAMQQKMGITAVVGDQPGQYAYTSTGKIYDNGTHSSTVTGWSATDVLGCGINFTDYEITFYRNGTLMATLDFSGSTYKDSPFLAQFGVFSAYAQGKDPDFSYNFKGPFGGRKPSGFVAFDFDNEVA